MKILSALRYDVLFQFRHGFYYAYALISVLYILLLRFIPVAIRERAAVLVIFSDPVMLGVFFVGGIILLEKEQRVLASIFITPFRLDEYIITRVISLTIIAELVSFSIIYFVFGNIAGPFNLFIGVGLSSVFFTLLGLALAARVDSINGYILRVPLVFIPLFLPILEYLNLFKTPLFYIIPSQGSLILIRAGFNDIPFFEWFYAIILLLSWIVIAYFLARKSFYKNIILQIKV